MSRWWPLSLEQIPDFPQQGNVLWGCRSSFGWGLSAATSGHQLINRNDDEEVKNRRHNEEIDDGVDEGTPVKGHTVDDKGSAMYSATADELDDWLNERLGELGDDTRESRTHNNRDCKVNDISSHDEVAKSLDHLYPDSLLVGIEKFSKR